ncbi:MAG: hypothetical protein U9P81_08895 [Euryarchaeota archaeon]|nr:hypothetical protein [Euryarchaeota archaeon]
MNKNSLPYPYTRKTRLLSPYIIYYNPDTSVKSGHSITNVIEFKSETSPATVADRVARFNESSRRMVKDGAQSVTLPPGIIFL